MVEAVVASPHGGRLYEMGDCFCNVGHGPAGYGVIHIKQQIMRIPAIADGVGHSGRVDDFGAGHIG